MQGYTNTRDLKQSAKKEPQFDSVMDAVEFAIWDGVCDLLFEAVRYNKQVERIEQMCGAYSQTRRGLEYFINKAKAEKLWEGWDFSIPELVSDRWNVRPTQVSVVMDNDKLEMRAFGLIPSWAKDAKMTFATFNARSETIDEKATFRKPFKENRGIVIIDGYYEFAKVDKESIPYFFTVKGEPAFAIAVLCDENTIASDKEIKSFSIVTVPANAEFESIHPRMPAILTQDEAEEWLNPDSGTDRLKSLLRPFPADLMNHWMVSKMVNSNRSEGSELINPI